MHEMSLCEGVLQILEAEGAKQKFSRVKKVAVEIGPFSGVEVEAFKFSFDVVMKGSLAENSELIILEIPATGWCMQCSETVTIKERYDDCPQCGSAQIQVTTGDELAIKELEVE